TLSGNPIAMAAGIATLKKLADRKIYKALKEKAKLFRDELEPALKRHKERVLFSQLESIFTFSFTNQEQISSVDDVKKCDMELFASFHAEMLSQGVYLAPSGYEVGFISSAHRDKDIKKTAEAVTKALKKIL
ncbi:MAG: aspartate aminotransferase family protein, partial [Deltaproteobacteria bacterium]|nr:aspartate aminotransferase family protein [Deltaproteobacteria bacterium]